MTAGCSVCDTDNKCFSERSVVIFDLDLEQNTQSLLTTIPLNPAPFVFQMGATNLVDPSDDPYRVPFQGLHFSKGLFLEGQSTISIPQIFTFEAYIRFDTDQPGTYGDLQYIYEARRNNNRFAIAIDNTYLKVIINSYEVSLDSDWLKSSAWRYLGVTVVKQYVDASSSGTEISSSAVKIYLDKYLAGTYTIPSYFQDDQSVPSAIDDTIGRNFHGVIRRVRLQSSLFCGALQSPSLTTSKLYKGYNL